MRSPPYRDEKKSDSLKLLLLLKLLRFWSLFCKLSLLRLRLKPLFVVKKSVKGGYSMSRSKANGVSSKRGPPRLSRSSLTEGGSCGEITGLSSSPPILRIRLEVSLQYSFGQDVDLTVGWLIRRVSVSSKLERLKQVRLRFILMARDERLYRRKRWIRRFSTYTYDFRVTYAVDEHSFLKTLEHRG